MYFKKLELSGFKSFAQKTVLHFEPGITAVVGPNGCGKSNIFDGIRWVLGEQSIKALRGADMQDVIFNGTETEAQLGFAEVALTFDNTNKNLPIEYEEVVVTRRLYRSGESEYLLNKNPVRLKDILTLFMGTGIGAESYSLVAQGKIDLIVSIKPEERRFIIDEAAGITKYKSKKKEALKKLEDTENNLLRVNDIISEVKRQISSIERQANKSRHYKEQLQKLKNLEIELVSYQLGSIDKEIEVKLKDIKIFEEKEKQLKEESSSKLSEIEKLKKETTVIQDKIKETEDNISEAKNLQELNNHNIKLNGERIEDGKKLINDLELKNKDLERRITQEEENVHTLDNELALLETKIKEAKNELINKEKSLEKNNSLIKAFQNDISQAKKEIFDKTTLLTKLKNDLTDASGQLISWQTRKRRLDIEVIKVREERSSIENQVRQVQEEFNSEETKILALKTEIEVLDSGLATKKSELDRNTKEITNLESELLTLDSQREFLENLKLRYDSLPETSQATLLFDSDILKQKLDPGSGIIGKVIEAKTPQFLVEIKPIDLDAQNITQRIQELKQKVGEIKSKKEEIAKEIHLKEGELIDKEKRLHQEEINFSNISIKKTDLAGQLVKFNEELELLESELKEAEDKLTEFNKTICTLNSDIANSETELKNLENKINSNQQEILKCNNLRETDLTNITRLKTELSALDEACNNQLQTRKFLEDTKKAHNSDRDSFLNQIKDLKEKIETAQKDILRFESENKKLNERLTLLDKELKNQEVLYNDNLKLLENLEKENSLINKSQEECSHQLFNLRLAIQEIEFKKKSILDRMFQLYQIQETDIKGYKPDSGKIEEPSISELQNQIDSLRKKIDAYGQVNLVADEEFEELKKRLEFLTTQSNDLLQAKESLLKAVRKINQISRKMFLETFEAVNEEFKNYFRMLFGGGQGHLFLIDEQDPLESGIEIVCRPPGKKLQNISLLSGGEKSLTAIALMFAVFKIKPAPFCVLDEVDSALDEANIDRFRVILEDFAKRAQFIVITHNKKTISSSDTMYGITMEQTGISKIVSVRFAKDNIRENDKEKEKELEPVKVS